MADETHPVTEEDARFDEILAGYLNAVRAGRPPSRDALFSEHPAYVTRLRAFFEDYDGMERLTGPLRELSGAGGGVSLADHPFEGYELLELIARGGMGVVYKARQMKPTRIVALKSIRSGQLSSPEDIQRFRLETQAVAALEHPNIVPIYDVGEREGHHFFTMRFVEGGSLESRLSEFARNPVKAARLVSKLARTIQYAHQRGIIHRDLKPGNILLDELGQPHLTDFGLAKRVGGGDTLTEAGIGIGTVAYMAPEQADPGVKRLTTRVDVYSLGVILYELLTGVVPFRGRSDYETVDQKLNNDPASPRHHDASIPGDLGAVCLKSLERDPERRYQSAGDLADDLDRWLDGKPVQARAITTLGRAWRWCRRKPLAAGLAVLGLALVAVVGLRIADQRARREETLKGNVYIAHLVANLVLHRLQEWSAVVEEASRSTQLKEDLKAWDALVDARPDRDVRVLLREKEGLRLTEDCALLLRGFRDPAVVNLQLMDRRGRMVVRLPDVPMVGDSFKERDYFQGTLRHAAWSGPQSVHVSSIYHSVADGLYKFDIGAPVVGPASEVLGVISVAVTTDPTLGIAHLRDEHRIAVLVGPSDTSRRPQDPIPARPPPEYVILLHPAILSRDPAIGVDARALRALARRRCDQEFSEAAFDDAVAQDDEYRDPLSARDASYAGRWLAGFAPVGNTGFVVIVQQKYE